MCRKFLANPWGNARGTLRARGVSLSPRGSVQDLVLQEVVQRERFEDYQKHMFLGTIMAGIFGINQQVFTKARELLELAIFQTAYDPQAIRAHMQQAKDMAQREEQRRLRDARLLARTARYSEDETVDANEKFRGAVLKHGRRRPEHNKRINKRL